MGLFPIIAALVTLPSLCTHHLCCNDSGKQRLAQKKKHLWGQAPDAFQINMIVTFFTSKTCSGLNEIKHRM